MTEPTQGSLGIVPESLSDLLADLGKYGKLALIQQDNGEWICRLDLKFGELMTGMAIQAFPPSPTPEHAVKVTRADLAETLKGLSEAANGLAL